MTPQELVTYQRQWAKENPGRTNRDYARAKHPHEPMARNVAVLEFRNLVARYGLHWTASVPREACAIMNEIDRTLVSEKDRREALGLPA